jgi:hypothetical protein
MNMLKAAAGLELVETSRLERAAQVRQPVAEGEFFTCGVTQESAPRAITMGRACAAFSEFSVLQLRHSKNTALTAAELLNSVINFVVPHIVRTERGLVESAAG